MPSDSVATPVELVNHPLLLQKQITLAVLREDLVHPLTGGNKSHKLKYNLIEAKKLGHDMLLTFGGAFSNHLVATAVLGKQNGFKTIGIVRGEHTLPLNRSLQIATDYGMQLQYVSRQAYRNYRLPGGYDALQTEFGACYILPEGGGNSLAVKGCSEIMQNVLYNADALCVASATGTTLAGLISAAQPRQQVIGFCVLKNALQQEKDIAYYLEQLHCPNKNWKLIADYHFGGYAKTSRLLDHFVNDFGAQQNIPIEPIYTGKMLYGVFDLIKKDFFKPGTRLLAIHTGGLQYLGG